MLMLIIGLILFFGLHSVGIVAPYWRLRMLLMVGEGGWKGVYSVLSGLGFVLMIIGFAQARHGAQLLYAPPVALRYLTFVLMAPVFPLLLAAYLPGRIQTRARHPMLAAVILWATAHLLAIGTVPDVLLFGSFLLWAIIDRIAVKRRQPSPARRRLALPYGDVIAVTLGLLLYALFLLKLHTLLIGVSPLVRPL
ncbi:MAG TPA: NnrU family protein [Steroidobacteraceae bacterium]|jgi:uncharacterized membrane protein|nr:NnrU family protein [Steroidobacteraceae bacterium]